MNKKIIFTLLLSFALPAALFAQAAQQYPVKIDDYLTLSNVVRGKDVTTIEFTITNIANLDAAAKEELKEDIVSSYVVSICEDQQALDAVNNGHVLQTNYRDENNVLLASVVVDKNTCAAK